MTDGEKTAQTDWTLVLLLFGAGVVCAFQIGKAAPALPYMRQEFGIGMVAAGWILSLYNLIAAASGITAGAVSDLAGHRRSILFGLSCMATAGVAGALMSSPTAILVTRFGEGLGYIMVMVSIPSLMIRVCTEHSLRLALGIWASWLPVGVTIMILSSPFLLEPFGWRGLWFANAAIVVLYGCAFAWATRRLARHASQGAASRENPWTRVWRDSKTVVTNSASLALMFAFAAYGMSFHAIFGFLPILLMEEMGVTATRAALLTAGAWSGNIVGPVAGGYLLHMGMPRWSLLLIGSLVMGTTSVMIYEDGFTVETRFAMCIVFAAVGGTIPAAIFGAVPVLAPQPTVIATVNGLVTQGANLGILLGPPMLALVVTGFGGWAAAPLLTTACAAVGIGLAVYIGICERRTMPTPT